MIDRIFISIVFIAFFTNACKEKCSHAIYPLNPINNEDCERLTKGHFKMWGYCVSNYYELSESISFDIDKNGIADSIAILSPHELAARHDECAKSDVDEKENRLLIIALMGRDSIKKRYLFDNVISNEKSWRVHQGEEYIEVDQAGTEIVLFQSYGQACSAEYYIYIRYDKRQEFVVDSLVYKSKCPVDNKALIEVEKLPQKPLPLDLYKRDWTESFMDRFEI